MKEHKSPLAKGGDSHHFETEKLGNVDCARDPKELNLASDGAFRIQNGGLYFSEFCARQNHGPTARKLENRQLQGMFLPAEQV